VRRAGCASVLGARGDNKIDFFTAPGPEDSPFAGGTFLLDIEIPASYPFEPPKVSSLPTAAAAASVAIVSPTTRRDTRPAPYHLITFSTPRCGGTNYFVM
jgi:hypothetical protein